MAEAIRVVHYLNQFFGGIGGEEKAYEPVQAKREPVGPGRALQAALGNDATIVGTLIAGDNYFTEELGSAKAALQGFLDELRPDAVIAGPAFDAGRYGLACAEVCRIAGARNIPAVTGMHPDNAGILTYRRDVLAVSTGTDSTQMVPILRRMAALALKRVRGAELRALSAVDLALWDILGKTLDAPVHRLLGGSAYEIPLYGTGTTMFEQSAQWHAHYFDQCIELGFAGVKVRLGRTIDGDTEAVATVRDHVGPGKLMGVDSYWFHDPDSAIELCRRIAGYGIHFFEEPVPQYQIEGLERLQHNSPIRVAVGERVYSPRMYAELARRDAARVFEPDASLTGGILSCLEIADIAARSSIEVIPHVGGPTVVGLAANLHWATAARVRLCEYDIDPHQPMITDIGDNPGLALTDLGGGHITAPTGPGLGVDVDEEKLAAHPYRSGDTYAELFPEHESGRTAAGSGPADASGA